MSRAEKTATISPEPEVARELENRTPKKSEGGCLRLGAAGTQTRFRPSDLSLAIRNMRSRETHLQGKGPTSADSQSYLHHSVACSFLLVIQLECGNTQTRCWWEAAVQIYLDEGLGKREPSILTSPLRRWMLNQRCRLPFLDGKGDPGGPGGK